MRRCWTALLALAAMPAFAAADTAEWLVRISTAAREANYRGVIVYQSRDTLESMRVVHRFQDNIEMERVLTQTGLPSEIIKQNDRVICLLPRDRRMTVQRPTPKALFPGLTLERVAQIAQVYEFESLGTERIAGRICRGVAVTPRDQYRYGYEVWADEVTAVPLKVNLVSRDGAVLEQMMFTQVDFPQTIPDSALRSELDPDQQYVSEPPLAPAAPAGPLPGASPQFVHLPPGFRVTMRDLRPTPDGKGVIEHLVLSDGLSAVSVFRTRKVIPARVFQGVSQIGAVHAYGRMQGTVHITVVGEAPPETVRLIGENFKIDDAEGAAPPSQPAVTGAVPAPAP